MRIASGNSFQCSSASRKFLTLIRNFCRKFPVRVSVLFSEPKIPHLPSDWARFRWTAQFQCSSASRKFLTSGVCDEQRRVNSRFSALQRAENSSPKYGFEGTIPGLRFQCSSASRKFLTRRKWNISAAVTLCFSALQRAENSSPVGDAAYRPSASEVSVLFSEPKIPHPSPPQHPLFFYLVSVLFSEPKIPHLPDARTPTTQP